MGFSICVILALRRIWRRNADGKGRYVRASTRDLDDNDDTTATASEEIIQSRLMDVDDEGSKTNSIAMKKIEKSIPSNPFATRTYDVI